jgi:hypothetical protein
LGADQYRKRDARRRASAAMRNNSARGRATAAAMRPPCNPTCNFDVATRG